MYILQNLKHKTYAIFGALTKGKVMWHSNKNFATHVDTKDELEDLIKKAGLDRDILRIININI